MHPRCIPSNHSQYCRSQAASRDPGAMGIPYRGWGLISLVGTTHDTSLLYAATRGRRAKHPCLTLMHGGSTAHHHAGTTCHIALAVIHRLPVPHNQAMKDCFSGATPSAASSVGTVAGAPTIPNPINLHHPRPPPRRHHFLRDATTRVSASRPPEPPTTASRAGLPTALQGTVPLPLGRSSGHPGLSSTHLRTFVQSAAVPTSP